MTDIKAALMELALPTTCPLCQTGTPDPCPPGNGVHIERIVRALTERSVVAASIRERNRNIEERSRIPGLIERLQRNAAGTVMEPWEWEALVAERKVFQLAPSRLRTQPYPIVGSGRDFRR